MTIITKPKIIKNQVKTIKQTIIKVDNDKVIVESSNSKQYPVSLSDYVRLTLDVNVGDIAIIKTFKNNWIVVDVVKKIVEPLLDGIDGQIETERQEKELEDIGWGAY